MTLKFKKLTETAITPKRSSTGAAGFDLYADSVENAMASDKAIYAYAGSNVKIHTGIAMSIPKGYVGLIFPRSGLACKQGIRLANCVGVIDEDYRGEIIVCMHIDKDLSSNVPLEDDIVGFDLGDRIAQIVFVKYNDFELEETDKLDDTERGENGFGSTGTK